MTTKKKGKKGAKKAKKAPKRSKGKKGKKKAGKRCTTRCLRCGHGHNGPCLHMKGTTLCPCPRAVC